MNPSDVDEARGLLEGALGYIIITEQQDDGTYVIEEETSRIPRDAVRLLAHLVTELAERVHTEEDHNTTH